MIFLKSQDCVFKWRFCDIWPPDVNLVRVERSPLPLSPAPPHPPHPPPSSPPPHFLNSSGGLGGGGETHSIYMQFNRPPPPTSWCVCLVCVCLSLCVVHAQCCQVPKKFPANTSKKFGKFEKKLGKFPKTSISQCLVY